MKIFIAICCLFTFSIILFAESLPKQNLSESCIDLSEFSETGTYDIPGRWWIQTYHCGPISTYCCCDDGNSRVCDLPGTAVYCLRGGIFECGSDLSGCEQNPSNCDPECCPECA